METWDYEPTVKLMVQSDLGSSLDLTIRYTLISIAGILLYVATGQPLMLIWLCFYLTVNGLYSLHLWRTKGPVSLSRYARLLAMNMVSSGSFSCMVLYLTVQSSPGLQAVGICGLAGQAFYNLSRHTAFTTVARWDTFSIVASCIFVGGVHAMRLDGTLAYQIIVIFGFLAISIYYVVAQHSVFRVHRELEAARAEAAQAQKMHAIGQLTSGIAHDFNNLLTVMRGNVELAELAQSDAERHTALNETKTAADRAARLIDHMLAFSHKAHLEPDTIDLESALSHVQIASEGLLPDTIRLVVEASGPGATVLCDSGQLQTALVNLIVNARDAMRNTGGEVHMSAAVMNPSALHKVTPLSPEREYIRITVSDTGPGVTSEELARMTEPFYTTKPTGQGSGLGLSMVKGFAEQSDGTVLFASPPSGGLHVHLILPTGRRFHKKSTPA